MVGAGGLIKEGTAEHGSRDNPERARLLVCVCVVQYTAANVYVMLLAVVDAISVNLFVLLPRVFL